MYFLNREIDEYDRFDALNVLQWGSSSSIGKELRDKWQARIRLIKEKFPLTVRRTDRFFFFVVLMFPTKKHHQVWCRFDFMIDFLKAMWCEVLGKIVGRKWVYVTMHKGSCADRISVLGENFGGSSSEGVQGAERLRRQRNFENLKKDSLENCKKCIISDHFSKYLKTLHLISICLDEKHNCEGKFWENFEKFQRFLKKIAKMHYF